MLHELPVILGEPAIRGGGHESLADRGKKLHIFMNGRPHDSPALSKGDDPAKERREYERILKIRQCEYFESLVNQGHP
jgi:hypothetical protein